LGRRYADTPTENYPDGRPNPAFKKYWSALITMPRVIKNTLYTEDSARVFADPRSADYLTPEGLRTLNQDVIAAAKKLFEKTLKDSLISQEESVISDICKFNNLPDNFSARSYTRSCLSSTTIPKMELSTAQQLLRNKQNEPTKEQYRERKIKECGDEVVYMMVRPGRPRTYGIETPLQNNTMSTPSTIAHTSTNGSDDET
jgi:hypothetical protein